MMKASMKRNFDIHHRANTLDPLSPGQQVWISGRRDSGVVVEQSQSPRSYIVATPTGDVRRNRRHLTRIPDSENKTRTNTSTRDNVPNTKYNSANYKKWPCIQTT